MVAPAVQNSLGDDIAFWSDEELSDLSPRLADVFSVERLARDYENAWEWLEAVTPEGLHVNISRTHNWETGDHHLPIIVRVSHQGYITPQEVERWARTLAARLDVDVAVGKVTEERTNSSEYGFRRDYECPKPKRG